MGAQQRVAAIIARLELLRERVLLVLLLAELVARDGPGGDEDDAEEDVGEDTEREVGQVDGGERVGAAGTRDLSL